MSTPSLTEFLLARIAEDEEMANRSIQIGDTGASLLAFGQPDAPPAMVIHPARVLAECEAKRRIVGYATAVNLDSVDLVVAELALPYADHPDYDESWRP